MSWYCCWGYHQSLFDYCQFDPIWIIISGSSSLSVIPLELVTFADLDGRGTQGLGLEVPLHQRQVTEAVTRHGFHLRQEAPKMPTWTCLMGPTWVNNSRPEQWINMEKKGFTQHQHLLQSYETYETYETITQKLPKNHQKPNKTMRLADGFIAVFIAPVSSCSARRSPRPTKRCKAARAPTPTSQLCSNNWT